MVKIFENYPTASIECSKIEKALHSIGVGCRFISATDTVCSITYYFEITNGKSLKTLRNGIFDLETILCLPKGTIRLTTEIKGANGAHFALIVEKEDKPLLKSEDFKKSVKTCDYLIGIDSATGEVVKGNLLDTPHLLIGGASGSGKSVLLHSIIKSLLNYQNSNIGLCLIDTKQVELTEYTDHDKLCAPIATTFNEAVYVLRVINQKMTERYEHMAKNGLKVYNGTKWVIVIDEFADLMLTDKRQIEPLVVRIAQMGRACGIHLVIATQRPSVDVCTGLIKANIPHRIALPCASARDSMVILDTKGAELLKGKGEALVRMTNIQPLKTQCFYK